jgi:dephospho-CoA kinase
VRIFGLTGPIASGKSTVARLLAAHGARVIDADRVARETVAKGQPALERIVEAFGPGILLPNGELDREKMGAVVFADPAKKRLLESITHPAIGARIAEEVQKARDKGVGVLIIEAILILQSPMRSWLNGVIVVDAPEATRRQRLAERDGMAPAEIEKRLASQRELLESFKQAEHHLTNAGSLEALGREVTGLWGVIAV